MKSITTISALLVAVSVIVPQYAAEALGGTVQSIREKGEEND